MVEDLAFRNDATSMVIRFSPDLATSELRMVKVNLEYEGGVSLLARFGNKPNRLVESQSKYWFLLEWI